MTTASPYWYRFDDGGTIGMRGGEGGTILADEQHDDGARLSLEGDCALAPYAIHVTIYGWGFHTRFFADEATARQAFDAMREGLTPLLALLPKSDDDLADADAIEAALTDFIAQFP